MRLLDAAVAYAGAGLRVHPLRRGSKKPTLEGWPDLAATDVEVIQGWWMRWPDAGIGIATGIGSGVIVVDVDPRHRGDDELAELERRHGELPPTWRALTANGGVHVYFAHPGGHVGNRAGLWRGIDLRGDGGYVVAAPSVLDGGRRYCWEIGNAPHEIKLAAAPAWLLDRLRHHGDRLQHDGTPLVIPQGERNSTLFRLACAFRRYGLDAETIVACLAVVNARHCMPPEDAEAVADIAARAARYEPGVFTPFHPSDAAEARTDAIIARKLQVVA
jgi:hypothetical protein